MVNIDSLVKEILSLSTIGLRSREGPSLSKRKPMAGGGKKKERGKGKEKETNVSCQPPVSPTPKITAKCKEASVDKLTCGEVLRQDSPLEQVGRAVAVGGGELQGPPTLRTQPWP